MKFSLVLATVNRVEELKRFLIHLNKQTYRNFELIIVDQNSDDRLLSLVYHYNKYYSILHIHSAKKGLSHARNQGLKHITGDIISFPDDDCWYPHDLLYKVKQILYKNNIDGVTGCSVDADENKIASRWLSKSTNLNIYNVWIGGVSITIFLKLKMEQQFFFDETLGVGANTPWGSGEETDYLVSIIKAGYKIVYNPSIMVYHPNPVMNYDEKSILRAKYYSAGMGRVLKKQNYPFGFVLYQWIRPIGGMFLSFFMLKIKKSKYHWTVFKGRVKGWFS